MESIEIFADNLLPLTLSLSRTRCASPNTDLHSNSNISKTAIVKIVLKKKFLKEYSISFLLILRLIDFALVVL